MKKKIITIFLVLCLTIISIGMAGAHEDKNVYVYYEEKEQSTVNDFNSDYGIQWEMNYGSDPRYGARYEGPQPIGDCDNDGDNELLISGRDASIRVMEWSESHQYELWNGLNHFKYMRRPIRFTVHSIIYLIFLEDSMIASNLLMLVEWLLVI